MNLQHYLQASGATEGPYCNVAAVLQQVLINNNGELSAQFPSRLHPAQLRSRLPDQPRLWGGQPGPKPGGLQLQQPRKPYRPAQWQLPTYRLCECCCALTP